MKKLLIMMMLVLSLAALVACGGKTEAPAEGGAEAVTLNGTAEGFKGPIEVTVTKEGDKIIDVVVDKHEESVDDVAEVKTALETIPAAIVEKNGTEGVEVVSGATYTSQGIIDAVNAALESGK